MEKKYEGRLFQMLHAQSVAAGDRETANANLYRWLRVFFPGVAETAGRFLDAEAAKEQYYKEYGRPGDPQYEEMVRKGLEQLERFEEETRIDPSE